MNTPAKTERVRPRIHKHAEDQRRRRQPHVQAGIYESINPSEGARTQARRSRSAHQHVARRSGNSHAETHERHDAEHRPTRNNRERKQKCKSRGDEERNRDNFLLSFFSTHQKPTGCQTRRATGKIGSQSRCRCRERKAIQIA